MDDELGAVASGYFADLDALADVNVAINKVKWVMRGGAVAADKTEGLVR